MPLALLEHGADDDQESDGEHSPDQAECDHLLLELLVHRMTLKHVCIGDVYVYCTVKLTFLQRPSNELLLGKKPLELFCHGFSGFPSGILPVLVCRGIQNGSRGIDDGTGAVG